MVTDRTLAATVGHLELESEIGGYEAATLRRPELDAVRASIAQLLGVATDEVAVTTSDTAAWTKAFWGFALAGGFDDCRRVIVDRVVYNSHFFALLQAQPRFDLEIVEIGPGADGTVDLEGLAAELRSPAAMLTATHVPTHSGLVNPVAEVGRLAREAGVPFFLDACQSVGQLPVDAAEIGCDVLTATGRKWLRGPRGTGLLVVRREFLGRLEPPGIDAAAAEWVAPHRLELAADSRRFEEFEVPVAAQLGLGAAVEQLLELGVDAVSRADRRAARPPPRPSRGGTRGGLTDGDGPCSGIVTFTVRGRTVDQLAGEIAAGGINVSIGRASHARLDMDARHLEAAIRASPHIVNTHDGSPPGRGRQGRFLTGRGITAGRRAGSCSARRDGSASR